MALTITCPICGKRNGYEFRFGGEEKGHRPDEAGLTAAAWSDYVHMNKSVAGTQQEWWFHRDGCGSWFTIYRNTTTNLEVDQPQRRNPPQPANRPAYRTFQSTTDGLDPACGRRRAF